MPVSICFDISSECHTHFRYVFATSVVKPTISPCVLLAKPKSIGRVLLKHYLAPGSSLNGLKDNFVHQTSCVPEQKKTTKSRAVCPESPTRSVKCSQSFVYLSFTRLQRNELSLGRCYSSTSSNVALEFCGMSLFRKYRIEASPNPLNFVKHHGLPHRPVFYFCVLFLHQIHYFCVPVKNMLKSRQIGY